MDYNNTLLLVKVTRGSRIYLKQNILDRLGIQTGDQFEVWVDKEKSEILLKPYKIARN